MKQFALLFLLLGGLLFSQITLAQLSYGVKSGVNLSSIGGESIEDVDLRTGFHIGLLGRLELSEKFALQPEIQYSQRGFKSDAEAGDFDPSNPNLPTTISTVETSSRFDYVDIPLIAQYKLTEGLTVEAGPQLGFFLSESIKVDGDDIDNEQSNSDSFALAEVGLLGGLGYYLDSGLFFQARYILGVTSIFDKDVQTLNDDGVFNRNIQFSIGYFFN